MILSQARAILDRQFPSYEVIWTEGYHHGQHSIEDTNPYPLDSEEYHYWSDGFWAAFYGEAAWFETKEVKTAPKSPVYTTVSPYKHTTTLQCLASFLVGVYAAALMHTFFT